MTREKTTKRGKGLFVLPKRLPKKLQYKIDGDDYISNGEHKEIDVSPSIIKNRLMVPTRNIAEELYCNVDYNKDREYEVEIISL